MKKKQERKIVSFCIALGPFSLSRIPKQVMSPKEDLLLNKKKGITESTLSPERQRQGCMLFHEPPDTQTLGKQQGSH